MADPDPNVFLGFGSGSGIIIPDPDPTNINGYHPEEEERRKFNIFTLKEGGGTYR